ncbi:MAG TPA: DUF1775 domain-containing protein [Candidatus Binatia bacterium]|nr:DUF1775 domain-containing protein [Candidatus Binatia bacterium]
MRHRVALSAFVGLAALIVTDVASAHAKVSPSVVQAKDSEVFTLAVPTEKENATTTTIEFTPTKGFAIDSFFPSPGWTRSVQTTGTGENAVVQKVTWSGGTIPTGEDAAFSFLASTSGTGTYTFDVRQTYSDGSIVDWSGPESSDSPAPTIKAVSTLGGGVGTSALGLVAIALAAVALILAGAGLLARGGRSIA